MLIKAGADGYLLKSQDKQKFVRSLKDIMDGAPPLSSSFARRIIKYFSAKPSPAEFLKPVALTQREEQVLFHIAKGMTRYETGQILGIRSGTVAGYIKRVYQKLDISSRAETALEAQRMGLI